MTDLVIVPELADDFGPALSKRSGRRVLAVFFRSERVLSGRNQVKTLYPAIRARLERMPILSWGKASRYGRFF